MSLMGRLPRERLAKSMPVDAPLYPRLPVHYRDTELLTIVYETDPQTVLDLIPEGLELPPPATATAMALGNRWTTIGPSTEMMIALHGSCEGTPIRFVPYMLVDADAAMAVGREVWGIPKKLGKVTITHEHEIAMCQVERPTGNLLATALVAPEQPVRPEELPPSGGPFAYLKVIPDSEGGPQPAVAEITASRTVFTPIEIWRGRGSLHLTGSSLLDPWHRVPVCTVRAAFSLRADVELNYPQVIKRYRG